MCIYNIYKSLKILYFAFLQEAVETFLSRVTKLEVQSGWSEADVLNLALLENNLMTFRNGIINSDLKGFPSAFYLCFSQ